MKNWKLPSIILLAVIILVIFGNQNSIWKIRNTILSAVILKNDKNWTHRSLYIAKRCPIFTYFELLQQFSTPALIEKLEIWGYAFYAQGFFPIVLNQEDARSRTDFRKISEIFSKFPTTNAPAYELSCYIRWVALQQQGGGLLTDYDILPMVSPFHERMIALKKCRWEHLTTYTAMKPMITHGNATEIEKWIQYMLNFNLSNIVMVSGKPHISDMLITAHAIRHNPELFIVESDLPWLHYSFYTRNSIINNINRSASEIMSRNLHMYHFLHHDIYLPISTASSPYSTFIIRALALCPDIITPYHDVDNMCSPTHKIPDICRLITLNGSWSPDDPNNGKCTWKIGPPDDAVQWNVKDRPLQDKEPFIVAVLPRPELYRWRHWLNTTSTISKNVSLRVIDFQIWASNQSSTLMLDALIPANFHSNQNNLRINHIINAMQIGQALLMTEEFIIENQATGQNEYLKRWISAHLGFFLTIPTINLDTNHKSLTVLEKKFYSGDDQLYLAVDQENQRWTNNWDYWRNTFHLSVHRNIN